jgi:prephenate dehydratase
MDQLTAGPIADAADRERAVAPSVHAAVAVRLPDRPGALGAVASRIGSVGADITDVTVSSRSGGFAEDVFHVDLPVADDVDVIGLLLSEISQVDGVFAPSVSMLATCCCSER